jgi:hypothetical protein
VISPLSQPATQAYKSGNNNKPYHLSYTKTQMLDKTQSVDLSEELEMFLDERTVLVLKNPSLLHPHTHTIYTIENV